MSQIILLLTVVGATGLFLYGMKLMSESVQKFAGERLRIMLSSMSTKPVRGVFIGLIVTTLIQSSSATTVMVVSFVNAGLLRLVDAIAVIMGANIGTTLTAWIISLVGFQYNFSMVSLPLIGISVPFLFSTNRKLRSWGELLLGFALIIISLIFIKQSIPAPNETLLKGFLDTITKWGYFSYALFFAAGAIFTMIIKSSSAIFALTLVFCLNGWISFEQATLMVLGENLGTTISALTASSKARGTAKRAALAHFFFNLFGVIWVLILFPWFIRFTIWTVHMFGGANPLTEMSSIPIALALFHTLFNLSNTLILFPFLKTIKKLVTRAVPSVSTSEHAFKFSHIKIGLLSTPEASLYQAKMETIVFAERVRKMFRNLDKIGTTKDEKVYQELKRKIIEDEAFSDRIEREIAGYLTKVAEGRLSESNSRRLRALFKMIDDIESIADSCMNIMNAMERQRERKINFSEAIRNNIQLMMTMVNESMDTMVTMLAHSDEVPLSSAQKIELEINNFRDILKSEHINNLTQGKYSYDEGVIYNDIISQCERVGDFTINVVEAYKNQF